MSKDPSWIREGAEVVVYSYGGGIERPWAEVSTIEKVNKKSFRVTDYGHLFSLIDQTYRGGAWNASAHVIPISDPRAPGLIRDQISRSVDRAAQRAVEAWRRDRSIGNTRNAIQALTRLYRDQEAIAQHQVAN